MKEGKILKKGTPNEIFKDSSLLENSDLAKPLLLELIDELNVITDFPDNKIINKNDLISFLIKKLK